MVLIDLWALEDVLNINQQTDKIDLGVLPGRFFSLSTGMSYDYYDKETTTDYTPTKLDRCGVCGKWVMDDQQCYAIELSRFPGKFDAFHAVCVTQVNHMEELLISKLQE